MEEQQEKIKVGITHGDINGISYEVIIKTLMDNRINEFCVPIVYGSAKVAAYHRKAMDVQNFNLNILSDTDKVNKNKPNVINCVDENIRVELGKSVVNAGKASVQALDKAVEDLKQGKIDVLVTAPINKENIQSEDFNFPGHTEYLMQQFQAEEVLMLLVSDVMRMGVVTGHVPLKQVSDILTQDLILRKLNILNKSLLQDFKIRKPKIAVFGLNPHASDGGVLGREENEVIIPAIQRAKENDIMAFGPYPADGFFGSRNLRKFDAILAMYHDQGLAPFKAISFDEGVNFTAGLNIVRTSPDHGTAYELAGKNEASPTSFRNALFLALEIYRNRKEHEELSSNPLESQDKSDI
ncbi:MAG: 4-hydroxythreonine-4-phosphate dehydrogenase PdxA [Bacteroidales bacterium]|nr:4-hydroxythreonine-4-phosphate dehydrogenase PdxA [Bacteroidales bacterium]